MTTKEAMEVLKTMNEMYPKFQLTERKAKILIPSLKEMDYVGVMKNLSHHVMHHLYPPTLSEIAAYANEESDSPLDEITKWQEEAKQVSPEIKQQFQIEFDKLARKIGGN